MSESASTTSITEIPTEENLSGPPAANRHRLPDERAGITHYFFIAGHEGYLTRMHRDQMAKEVYGL